MRKNLNKQKIDIKRMNRIQWLVFTVFLVLFVTVSFFHEPWFDEAQSWQIARCASLREILFVIPHYEGHPALWHLLLMLPAKLGVPYELGLKLIAGVITIASVWLIIFKSPFPILVKLLIPFNYFVFYQYGVVSRPYGLMLLAFILSALSFLNRNKSPFRFVGALICLCLTSAYGVVIAGGICLAWLIEIIKEKIKQRNVNLRDSRLLALVIILCVAILILVQIFPCGDTFGNNLEVENSCAKRLFYTVFVMPADAMMTSVLMAETSLMTATLGWGSMIPAALGTVILFVAITLGAPKGQAKYFFIPFFSFAVLCGIKYLYAHHIGIVVLLLLFWAWSCYGDETPRMIDAIQLEFSATKRSYYKSIVVAFLWVLLLIPLWWTGMACYHDIINPYNFGRETAEYIYDNIPLDAQIALEWKYDEKSEIEDVNEQYLGVALLPYFENNIFYTLNRGSDDYGYLLHRMAENTDNARTFDEWSGYGCPDVLLGDVAVEKMSLSGQKQDYYIPVFLMKETGVSIWKYFYSGFENGNCDYIYVRNDLVSEWGLKAVDPSYYVYKMPVWR